MAEIAAVERALTRLVRIAEVRRAPNVKDAASEGLDRTAYTVLARIEEMPDTRLTALASVMEIDLSTASRQVRALEERGYLTRIDDPEDQRAAWLELTDPGRDALAHARALRLQRIAARLLAWERRDVTDLVRLLEKLVTSFTERSPTEDDPHAWLIAVGGRPE